VQTRATRPHGPERSVDVVVVSYNSADELRGTVEALTHETDVNVIVVDNASTDDSLATIADLPVTSIALEHNRGFAHGCNAGYRAGTAPYVLLLNPDAEMLPRSLSRLVDALADLPTTGALAPRIVDAGGGIDFSLRRFPRLRSTYAQALFLHRLFPHATWTDEVIRDRTAYERAGAHDWVSGACILLRRQALDELGGLDDGFFMYCEDIDLCRRLQDAGWDVRFEPSAEVRHEGGASAPRASLLPVLAASRIRYAEKHRSRLAALAERIGIALGSLTHLAVSRGGAAARLGHARAFARAASRSGDGGPSH
jgi:N-acetylglucosaminyl-diphospho-decaprenol L-rhamnosyltransferase